MVDDLLRQRVPERAGQRRRADDVGEQDADLHAAAHGPLDAVVDPEGLAELAVQALQVGVAVEAEAARAGADPGCGVSVAEISLERLEEVVDRMQQKSGRASCREGGGQYRWISGVARSDKKN